MSKTIIEVKCTDQVLTLTNTPVIVSGGVGVNYISAEFCEKWDGLAVVMMFWRQGVDPQLSLENEEGLYIVPHRFTFSEGVVYFGAIGIDQNGVRRTSEAVSYRIQAGAITENTTLPEPDGDVFGQLLAQYADVKLYVSTRIGEAADAAIQAGENAQAALAAAEQAERHAEDAVDAVEDVIYPGIVEATLDDGANSIGVTLDARPPDKMFLTFEAPALYNTSFDEFYLASLRVRYPGDDGTETKEVFWLRDGWQSKTPDHAIRPYDVVTVLLTRVDGKAVAYIVNPRITKTTLDEMNQRLYPGIPASTTVDGTMTIALDYVPEDKMVLVFAADEASSQVTKFQLEYETEEDGLVQVEYTLCDANNSPVESYGFYEGDYVVALLTPKDKRATVLNPRVTRDTMNLIRGLVDELGGQGSSGSGGCSVVSYVGDGTGSLRLVFSGSPKVIQIESLGAGGYSVSAILSRDDMVAKVKVFSDGNYYENIVNLTGYAVWNGNYVTLGFSSSALQAGQLNVNNTKYIAIGIM